MKFIRHFLFWLLYLLFQTYIEYTWISKSFADLNDVRIYFMALQVEVILLIPKLFFCYAVAVVFEYKFESKAFLLMLLKVFLLLFVSVVMYRVLTMELILPKIYMDAEGSYYSLLRAFTAAIDIITISGVYHVVKLYKLQIKNVKQEKELIKSKLETELNFLKAQTNPHFLFNTLNNVYGISKRNPDLSSDIILKLSKILRYTTYGVQKELVNIEDEINVIQYYIEIERLRYANKLQLTLQIDIDSSHAEITPMILLPIVENAFKHGVAESIDTSYVNIALNLNSNFELNFTVENSKADEQVNNNEGGIGLKNIKRQLDLLYSDYKLNIVDIEHLFKVELYINLKSYEKI